jgi:hypothetical protein
MPCHTALTDFLRSHGEVPDTVLVNLNFSRKTLAVKCWSNERFWHLRRAPAFHLDEVSLFNDIGHFFLLLFSFVGLFLELIDLLDNVIEAVAIRRTI